MGEEMNDLREQLARVIDPDAYDESCHERFIDMFQEESLRVADAIIAALPSMVQTLVWDGLEEDCYSTSELDGGYYEVCVTDTLERACDYIWSAYYIVNHNTIGIPCGRQANFDAAIAAAQHHYITDTLARLGLTHPPQHDTPTP